MQLFPEQHHGSPTANDFSTSSGFGRAALFEHVSSKPGNRAVSRRWEIFAVGEATERRQRHSPRLVVPVLATILLLIGSRGPAAAQSPSPTDSAPLRAALVGDWVMDQEATADVFALDQFGPKRRVVPNRQQPRQPQTFSTNVITKPFNVQEYAMIKSAFLANLRANTNDVSSRMNFAPDGTGMNSDREPSGRQVPVEHFQWRLQGTRLTITDPVKKTTVQTEFTNRNQLSLTVGRGVRLVLKPDRPAPKPDTGAAPR